MLETGRGAVLLKRPCCRRSSCPGRSHRDPVALFCIFTGPIAKRQQRRRPCSRKTGAQELSLEPSPFATPLQANCHAPSSTVPVLEQKAAAGAGGVNSPTADFRLLQRDGANVHAGSQPPGHGRQVRLSHEDYLKLPKPRLCCKVCANISYLRMSLSLTERRAKRMASSKWSRRISGTGSSSSTS